MSFCCRYQGDEDVSHVQRGDDQRGDQAAGGGAAGGPREGRVRVGRRGGACVRPTDRGAPPEAQRRPQDGEDEREGKLLNNCYGNQCRTRKGFMCLIFCSFCSQRKAKYSENKLKTLKARNEYLLTLEATNASVFKYYIHDLPDIIDVSKKSAATEF